MAVFWIIASLMVFVALGLTLPPLIKRRPPPAGAGDDLNVAIYHQRLGAIDAEVEREELSPEAAHEAREELQRQLLDDLDDTGEPGEDPRNTASGTWVAFIVAAGLPMLVFGLYLVLGTPRALTESARMGDATTAGAENRMPHSIEEMVTRLEARLREQPDDPDGWVMLGRSYAATDRLADARHALEEANRLRPDDPLTLTAYAEVLAGLQGDRLDGDPVRLIERALEIEPNFARALWLAGIAAFRGGDFDLAVQYWQRILDQGGLDEAQTREVRAAINQVRAAASSTPESAGSSTGAPAASSTGGPGLTVNVSLAPELESRAAATDTVFVLARAADGPRMPLAVVRKTVAELPLTVVLDDTMAMSPQFRLSSVATVEIVARISRSGNATPAPGDLAGRSGRLSTTQSEPVTVLIDEVVREQ